MESEAKRRIKNRTFYAGRRCDDWGGVGGAGIWWKKERFVVFVIFHWWVGFPLVGVKSVRMSLVAAPVAQSARAVVLWAACRGFEPLQEQLFGCFEEGWLHDHRFQGGWITTPLCCFLDYLHYTLPSLPLQCKTYTPTDTTTTIIIITYLPPPRHCFLVFYLSPLQSDATLTSHT